MPYGTYRTADGFVNIAGGNDALYRKLCVALDAHDLLEPHLTTNADRIAQRAEVTERLEAHLSRFTTEEAIERLQTAGVACGPVWTVAQVMQSEWAAARGIVQTLEHPAFGPVRVTAPPFKFDGERPAVRIAPPALGQDEHEILREVS
jgi:formyl-CoA transferase